MIEIRTETEKDRPAIHRVNESAFAGTSEADLVDALREVAHPHISLVAVVEIKLSVTYSSARFDRVRRLFLYGDGLAPWPCCPNIREGNRSLLSGKVEAVQESATTSSSC